MKKFRKKIRDLYQVILTWIKRHLVGIAVIWLVVGFILLAIYLGIYRNVTWGVLTGFATWILAGGVVVAVWQAADNNYQAKKGRSAQVALGLYNELRNSKSRKILQEIYRVNPESFNDESFIELQFSITSSDVDSVIDILGTIGSLICHGILDEELAIESFGGVTALKCWHQLRIYMRKLQGKRGMQTGSYFEDFASRALEHFQKKYEPGYIKMYHEEGSQPFDLLQTLNDVTIKPQCLKKQTVLQEKQSSKK
jgi:hypothetical protein